MNMTDKLGIVKAFGCGASLLARALFVRALQPNAVFVVVSVSRADVYPAFTFSNSGAVTDADHTDCSHFFSTADANRETLESDFAPQRLMSC